MKKDPFVDVIMPNYNKDQFLEETINSVISQEYKNWNLLIIDSSSNDNSKKILNKFKNTVHNINIIYLPRNKGLPFSRNLGIRLSKAEYISFLDADDIWSTNKLKKQMHFMQEFNHNFTYTDYIPFISRNNKKIFMKDVIVRNSFNFDQFINDTSLATSSMVIKRSIINIIKFPKVKNLDDYCFKCRILKKGNEAIKLKQNPIFYRVSDNTYSSNKFSSLYWLWLVNKKYNKLSFYLRVKSALLISLGVIKRYGFKYLFSKMF